MNNTNSDAARLPAGDWIARNGSRTAIGLFVLALVLTIWNIVASDAARTSMEARNAAILGLERVLLASVDMETGERGFIVTGSDTFLQPFLLASQNLPKTLAVARDAWARTGRDADDLTNLTGLVGRKLDFAQRVVDERRRSPEAAIQLVASGDGKQTMDAIRAAAGDLQARAVRGRQDVLRSDRLRSAVLTTASFASALAALALLGWLAWHQRRIAVDRSSALLGLRDRFAVLADNIPQLAWMASGSGNIHWYNRRWYDYTGMSPSDMDNDGWKKAHDPHFVDAVSARFAAAISAGQTWSDTFPLRGRDGTFRWFLSRAEPIRGQDGRITGWFGTNTDVTEQKEQEAELAIARDAAEQANAAKSDFLANMSHELRTPLSAIIGYSEMMMEDLQESGDDSSLSDMRKIEGNARHLLGLINDVLDLSKIEAGKMEIYAEDFAVEPMLGDIAGTVQTLVDKKRNRFELRLASDLGAMHSDVTKIRQVLLNFISNAAKFTEAGAITLSAERVSGPEGDRLRFSVSDTGIGMTAEQVDKLFLRFQQADSSTTRKYGGTGLGLSLTKAFADMLHGRVTASSVSGQGSTFTLDVPASYAPPAVAETASPDPDVVADGDGGDDLILVIDDDVDQCALTTRFLHREGFRVQVATNGRAGLALAKKLKPRAILLDVMMPGLDGWSVLSAIKADPDLSTIPVVMVTAVNQRTLAASLGAADYMLKPVNWERFGKVMDRYRTSLAGTRGHVLLVEDDGIIRAALRGELEESGWTVVEAGNGQEGLERAAAMPPAVVLVDLNMPVMDGFTFLTELRATPGCATVPVVVLTGRELSPDDRRLLRGASQVLNRGNFSGTDLVDRLQSLADNHRAGDGPGGGAGRA